MRALTLTKSVALAYLSGVLHGDAWLTKELGLRCADNDFAEAFAAALQPAFGIQRSPRRDERGYWLLRLGNASGRFDGLRVVEIQTDDERAAWLRGLFDSEGNANLHRVRGGPSSWGRRLAMYSTEPGTLRLAGERMVALGIKSRLRATKNSASHKGTKTVYEIALSGSRENYSRFADLVGSSIARKRETMIRIVDSYQADISAHCREKQLRGAATKTRRTLESTIPAVVAAIRVRIETGQPTTIRACAAVLVGYHAARKHRTHAQLMAEAKGGVPSVA